MQGATDHGSPFKFLKQNRNFISDKIVGNKILLTFVISLSDDNQ